MREKDKKKDRSGRERERDIKKATNRYKYTAKYQNILKYNKIVKIYKYMYQKPKSLVVWEGRPDFSFLFKSCEIGRI